MLKAWKIYNDCLARVKGEILKWVFNALCLVCRKKYIKIANMISKIFTSCFLSLLFACSTNGGNGAPQPSFNSTVNESENQVVGAPKAQTKEIIFHAGPIDLPNDTAPDSMLEKPLTMRFQVGEPVWITGFESSVIDSNGNKLPSALLHRAIIFNLHEENPLCGDSKRGNPILAASSTTSSIEFPQGYAYPLLPTDPIELSVSMKNSTDKQYSGVYFSIKLISKPMNEYMKIKDLKPMLISADTCEYRPTKVGAEAIVEEAKTYKFERKSSLMIANATMEDCSVTVALTKKTEAVPFWRVQAKIDDKNNILSLTDNPFIDPAGVSFKSGETVTFSSGFNNTSSKWSNTSTAEVMMYVAEEE